MDYEKKYKEALERAKSLIDKEGLTEGSYPNRNACEAIFPELVESEDERIRKELRDFVLYKVGHLLDENTEHKFIAYLEKQKEPLPIPDKFSGLKSLMLQYLQSAANRKDDTEIESDTDLWGRKILDYVWKYSDEQKEQKPAEWSEEDEEKLDDLINYFEGDTLDSSTEDMVAWLKSLRNGIFQNGNTHWKPSKEQVEALKECGECKRCIKQLYEQLKKL